jgi:hypothetical protein
VPGIVGSQKQLARGRIATTSYSFERGGRDFFPNTLFALARQVEAAMKEKNFSKAGMARKTQPVFAVSSPHSGILCFVNWATVTVTDSTGKRYSLDVQAESTYDAAHLFLTKAKEHVIREPLPIPSLETIFEVTVNGRVHKVPGQKLQRWSNTRREEWKGPRGILFKQRPTLGP